ncbi:MAG: hypothetical protein AVDCRST_MAG22-2834, partial [uncultured Rubrobacteraceae bacterium]
GYGGVPSPAGSAQAVDQERVRAGRGVVRREGVFGFPRFGRAAHVPRLLPALRGGLRLQRRAGRGRGPQAPAQEVQARGERGGPGPGGHHLRRPARGRRARAVYLR